MNSIIETHAHIYSDKFQDDLNEAIDRAKEIGVEKILMPNIDRESIDVMLEVAQKFPNYCLPMMGIHPCSVKENFEQELYKVEDWLNKEQFVAVGEMGIDLYWDKDFEEQQKEAFRIQVGFAKSKKLPIVIHSREANPVVIDLLEELQDGTLNGVLHCFSGTLEEANKIVELGMHLGVGGVATFKNGGLDKVLPHIALDKLVLETDCPYLAPVPFRGKRNEPAYLNYMVAKLSDFQEKTEEEIKRETTINAKRLFAI
jgi:TatD DNase family protein